MRFDYKLSPLSGSFHWGRKNPTDQHVWCPRACGSQQAGFPVRRRNHTLSWSSHFSLPSDFLMEGQDSALVTLLPLLTISFRRTCLLPLFKRIST